MAEPKVLIAGDRHLETLRNCGGYYKCPVGPDDNRLGPLVAYAGKYPADLGTQKQFVGEVYANFAKAEVYPEVLRFFAQCIAQRLEAIIGFDSFDVFCAAPIGGYALSVALGLTTGHCMIKAEKKVIEAATSSAREKSELVFGRHGVEEGKRYVIVEDVCNNFSTTEQLIKLIRAGKGKIEAIVCFLNRSMTVDQLYFSPILGRSVPVISLVRMPIDEWKQNDPAVANDIAKGNIVWKPKDKDEWARLMKAMRDHPQS
jgi:orotate phosphoribosyltransferase